MKQMTNDTKGYEIGHINKYQYSEHNNYHHRFVAAPRGRKQSQNDERTPPERGEW
jgi:hypothetical protein